MKRLISSLIQTSSIPVTIPQCIPKALVYSGIAMSIALTAASPALARGLYLDLPSWFQRADTSGTEVVMTETMLQADDYDASIMGLAVPFNLNSRTSATASLLYPVIRRNGGFKHGFADGNIDVVTRIAGDSLNTTGLFLRVDVRIPLGSGALYPFAYRSADGGIYPDVGAGLEYRKELPFGRLACCASYNFSGQSDGSDDPDVTDFLVGGVSLEIAAGSRTSLRLAVFGIDFKGPGYRESYLLALDNRLSGQLRLVVTGAVDAGDERDRVFDSLLQLMLEFDFAGAGG
ncbi:MAG TPA: hypothetical protein VLA34_12630 [Candidatus Krumholzibacterium sp.]|nr:hypothetical protein [Candidatus Krumholzibacterium sp.]